MWRQTKKFNFQLRLSITLFFSLNKSNPSKKLAGSLSGDVVNGAGNQLNLTSAATVVAGDQLNCFSAAASCGVSECVNVPAAAAGGWAAAGGSGGADSGGGNRSYDRAGWGVYLLLLLSKEEEEGSRET